MHIMDGSNSFEVVDWRTPLPDEWYLWWNAQNHAWQPALAFVGVDYRVPQVILRLCSGLAGIRLTKTQLEQLQQIISADAKQRPVWDGDLISKDATRYLADRKLVVRCQGYTMPTLDGKEVLKYNERPGHTAGVMTQCRCEAVPGSFREACIPPSVCRTATPVEKRFPYEGQVLRHKKSGAVVVGTAHGSLSFMCGTCMYYSPEVLWRDYEPFVVSDGGDE